MLVPVISIVVPLNDDTQHRLVLEDVERAAILDALEHSAWNISIAADRLGIYRQSLQRKMQKHGIPTPHRRIGRRPRGAIR